MADRLMQEIPAEVLAGGTRLPHSGTEYVKQLLDECLPNTDQHNDNYHKTFRLDKHKLKQRREAPTRQRKTYITRREKNVLGIGKLVARNGMQYSEALKLHRLWRGYITEYLQLDKYAAEGIPTVEQRAWESFSVKLLRADYHGAMFTVIRSTCPSLVGHAGICVMDTQQLLVLVSQDNITRRIPKIQSVFRLEIGHVQFTVFGKYMAVRSAERSTKKIKQHMIADL